VIPESETGELILALHRAAHATLTALQARLAGLNLTASEINALAILATGQPRSIGELAAATATKPTTLTSVLDRLVRRGLVVRQLDPADRRSFLVSLTQDGRPVADRARAEMGALERAALAAVTSADLAGFRVVTQAIMELPR
jgi:MarR family transcriptional regulator, organic hydroperoxide resistance regulator